jgi:hypothetical protein
MDISMPFCSSLLRPLNMLFEGGFRVRLSHWFAPLICILLCAIMGGLR